MDIKYFDAHTHIHFPAYEGERDAVMRRAEENGVGMVTVGTRKDTSESAVKFAEAHGNVWAAIGLHPGHAIESFHDADELGVSERKSVPGETFDDDFFSDLAKSEKVVAVGECGLDYFRLSENPSEREAEKRRQKEEFMQQIRFAQKIGKPLMIHCRDAYGDLIEILNLKFEILNSPPGIVHFFSGNADETRRLLDFGFYFTFGGTITFPPKKDGVNYAEIAEMIPMKKILSETDAPWVAPVPYRGKRNEPAYVVEVVKKLAEIKNVPLEAMREQILENARNAFGVKF